MITVYTTSAFDAWFAALADRQAKVRIQARIDRLEHGNAGDWKPVSAGVAEMRIDYGPGYRVYFIRHGMEVVILLAGGDKSTQARDIKAALRLGKEWEQ
jgi:putative addiction module killer protein